MQEMSITETTVAITTIITVRVLLLFPAKTQISYDQISRILNFGIALSSGELACIMESWNFVILIQSKSIYFLIKKKLEIVWANTNRIRYLFKIHLLY